MSRNSNLVYLAHPIDLGRADPELVDFATKKLNALGFSVYDPLKAFSVAGRPTGAVNSVNEAAMLTATAGVAFLPSDVQSIGVPAEISYLLSHGVPTLVVTDLGDTSWVVGGWAEHYLAELAHPDQAGVAEGLVKLVDLITEQVVTDDPSRDKIVFQRMHPSATLPTKGYDDDAGYDLYAAEACTVPARGQAIVSCGVSVDVPNGLWAQITGRSSTLSKFNLMVAPTVGVIDEGYTGELFAPIVSVSDQDVQVEVGQRLAQLVLHEAPGQRFEPTWGTVRSKPRGANGFGSTGR